MKKLCLTSVFVFSLVFLAGCTKTITYLADDTINQLSVFEIDNVANIEIGRVEEVLAFENGDLLIRLFQLDGNSNQLNHLIFVSGETITSTIPINQGDFYFQEVVIGNDNYAYVVERYSDDNYDTHYVISKYNYSGKLVENREISNEDYGVFTKIIVDDKVNFFYYDSEDEAYRRAIFNTDLTLDSDIIVDNGNLELGRIYNILKVDDTFYYILGQTINDVSYTKIFTDGGDVVFKENFKITKTHTTNEGIVLIQFLDWDNDNNHLIVINPDTMKIVYDYESKEVSNNITVRFLDNENVTLGWPFDKEDNTLFRVNTRTGKTATIEVNENIDINFLLAIYIIPNGTTVIVKENDENRDTILIYYSE